MIRPVAAAAQPAVSLDIAKIKADREALIAREAKRILDTPVSCSSKKKDCAPHPEPPVESWKTMVCGTCGSDFQAYPSEAKHCPACAGTDLQTYNYVDDTIYDRIWKPYYVRSHRGKTAAKRIDYLKNSSVWSKHKPVMTLQEGWVDSIPPLTAHDRSRKEMGLGDNDNYVSYARCGEYNFVGQKTVEDAKAGLIKHCSGCGVHKEDCWKPAQEDLPESHLTKDEIVGLEPSHDRCEVIDVPEGRIFWCHDTYTWMTACFEPDPDGIDHTTEKAAMEAITKHCQACNQRKDKCWKPDPSKEPAQEPDDLPKSDLTKDECTKDHIPAPPNLKLKDDEYIDEAGEVIEVSGGRIAYLYDEDGSTYLYSWMPACEADDGYIDDRNCKMLSKARKNFIEYCSGCTEDERNACSKVIDLKKDKQMPYIVDNLADRGVMPDLEREWTAHLVGTGKNPWTLRVLVGWVKCIKAGKPDFLVHINPGNYAGVYKIENNNPDLWQGVHYDHDLIHRLQPSWKKAEAEGTQEQAN